MRCKVAVVGAIVPSMSMAPRRRFTTGSCAGPSAGYGKVSSLRWLEWTGCPTGYSSTAPASRHTGQPEAQKGGLGQWYRPTRGGRNSKVHAICDTPGRPHVLMITPGNVHDMKVAKACIAAVPPSTELVGDKPCPEQSRRGLIAATSCVHGSPREALKRSSRPSAITKFKSRMIWQSTSSATSSNGL